MQKYNDIFLGGETLSLVIDKYKPTYILDIGCGGFKHTIPFVNEGSSVTGIDLGNQTIPEGMEEKILLAQADFNQVSLLPGSFDCVWASHVLEHQVNPGMFLSKCYTVLSNEGVFAVTVPPMKGRIVGGHVSLWNAGLLLYHMILAGFDCSEAHVKSYGYNVSVVVKKKRAILPELKFDAGDITALQQFFPKGLDIKENFDGEIKEHNWS